MKDKKFILFSNCIPVKGTKRSIICDLENNTFYFIPNSLYEILENYNGFKIKNVKKIFDKEYDGILDEYFDFLIEKNLIFFNNNPKLFPKLSLEWKTSSKITNCIIDFDENIINFESIILQTEKLKCSYIQLRFFKQIDIQIIIKINEFLVSINSRIVAIDFIFQYTDNLNNEDLVEILKKFPRIHSFIIYNAPYSKSFAPIYKKMGYLMFSTNNIINEKSCGIINSEYFYSNINLFSESQHHNTCLNRKISIDINGNIKNCPSMPQSFGNIKDTTLEQALEHPDFKKYWNITKDQIEVCKDCEFRHICTDCRAYTEDPENMLSKPLKCGYNPYTNVWEEWSTNPLKQKAIEYYGMQELVKKDA